MRKALFIVIGLVSVMFASSTRAASFEKDGCQVSFDWIAAPQPGFYGITDMHVNNLSSQDEYLWRQSSLIMSDTTVGIWALNTIPPSPGDTSLVFVIWAGSIRNFNILANMSPSVPIAQVEAHLIAGLENAMTRTVPEPASAGLIVLAAAISSRRRR